MTRVGGRTEALRLVHTMKGSARTLGLAKLQEATHGFESSLVSDTEGRMLTKLQTLREVTSAYQTAMGMRKAKAQGWQPQPGHDWLDFLFEDGVTTAEQLSASSGRGVGLPAVRAFAARMQGHVQLQNRVDGSGAELQVRWPAAISKHKRDAA